MSFKGTVGERVSPRLTTNAALNLLLLRTSFCISIGRKE